MVIAPARIVSMKGTALSVPLRDPFVIATGRMDVTRAVLVCVTVEDDDGRRATGYGEAAALPPVTHEDQPDLLRAAAAGAMELVGTRLETFAECEHAVSAAVPSSPVARAGIESAVLDAWARLTGVPLAHALAAQHPHEHHAGHADAGDGGPLESRSPLPVLTTDITLPIAAPEAMVALAVGYHAAGFSSFKVKVGRDWRADRAALEAVARAVPSARFRLDANGGFSAQDALSLLDAVLAGGLIVECYEQPCAREDLAGMALVTAQSPVPVVADESFRDEADLSSLLEARAAHAVNLKLVKLGGPLRALSLARKARAAGLRLMAGAMVETRVGLLAMAHVVAALGGVDWVDLDTAFLLADDPFEGGWTITRADITLTGDAGLGVRPRGSD